MLAAFAGVESQVIEGRRVKISRLPFIFFAAVHAHNAAKRPDRQTGGAEQLAAAAIGLAGRDENRQLRPAAAERAPIVRALHYAIEWIDAGFREPRCVRLKRGLSEEVLIRRRVPVGEQQLV